ncbi:hypothetical protein [Methylocystis bryophila]|uniref:hypothetical protein n=1 Tax=Methylocystis bryophila TaxID=655015 RepID=UPI000A26E509|nr:hypothetical protein [Methylocystis bryophila]
MSRETGPFIPELRSRAIFCVIAWLIASTSVAQTLSSSDDPPAEARLWPYSNDLPTCASERVLAEIARRFWNREREYWQSALSLETFDAIRETSFRPRGSSFIPRRGCEAAARFNDGATRRVIYKIGEGLGFIGLGWGVEWCVVGLDRGETYGPACAGVRP